MVLLRFRWKGADARAGGIGTQDDGEPGDYLGISVAPSAYASDAKHRGEECVEGGCYAGSAICGGGSNGFVIFTRCNGCRARSGTGNCKTSNAAKPSFV